jgi:hypothetical protein
LFDAIAAILAQQFVMSPYYFSVFHQNKERHLLRQITGNPPPRDAQNLRVGLFTDTLDDVNGVARFVRDMAEQAERAGRPYRIVADSAFGATYPWAWYFRDLENAVYPNLGESDDPPPQWDALILTEAANTRLQASLGGQRGRRFPFRIWWVPEYGSLRLRWLLDREPWNDTGGMPEFLYERG